MIDAIYWWIGQRLFSLKTHTFYHTDVRRGRVFLCGCARFIKHSDKWSPLGPNRKKDRRWGYKNWRRSVWL